MYSASDLKKGLKIEIDGMPWVITDFDFCKPGKGTALYRCRLKNLVNGAGMDRTFRPVDKVGKPDLEEREMHYIYQEGENFVFSDSESYEEIRIPGEKLDITLPTWYIAVVSETEPGARGDTASSNVMKPAKIENGYELMVPLFINSGDTIKIDTRTGEYAERVNKA